MKYQGEQSFEVGMSLMDIAECVEDWDEKDFAHYNMLTINNRGQRLFAPLSYAKGMGTDVVGGIWKITQAMDEGSYRTLNYMLQNTAVFLVPPPPPPPPPGNGQ